eukprot:g4427.t1
MPRILPVFLLAASSLAVAKGRLAATADEGTDHPTPQAFVGGDEHTQRELSGGSHRPATRESSPHTYYHDHKYSSDSYFSSSDKAAMEFNPSSDSSYYYSSKIKGKGFDPFSAMGWLTDGCPGDRTSDEKDHLYKSCARWSTGLEHESFLVHRKDEFKEEYVVNVGTVATQMSRYGRVFGLDRETHSVAVYLEHTGVEFSGRSCAGINEVNFKGMAESVSTGHKQLTFDSAFCQIQVLDEKIIEVVSASPGESNLFATLGEIHPPRSGMSSELGLYTRTGGKTHTCSTCTTCDLKDYTGSYHVSISLPHDPEGWILYDEAALSEDGTTCSATYERECGHEGETPLSVWVGAHANFANMVQWIEPLLLAVFGSPDDQSVCDHGEFIEGSYRTISSGWGVPGTTDVRTFGVTGTGRYTHKGFDWLLEVVPSSDAGIFGCTEEGMGSDIRTKSSVDEHFMLPGEELPPMDVGNGLEIRVFDNFPLENLQAVYRVLALLAENSRVYDAVGYVYEDAGWKASAQEAMKEGWNGVLAPAYVDSLEVNLGLDLSALGNNSQAFDVFTEVHTRLLGRHSDGLWTRLLLDDVGFGPALANPNRDSWERAAVDAGVTPSTIREALGGSGDDGPPGLVQLDDVTGGDCGCGDDLEDLVYLAQAFSMVDVLETNADGSVKAVRLHPASEDEHVPARTCAAEA